MNKCPDCNEYHHPYKICEGYIKKIGTGKAQVKQPGDKQKVRNETNK